MLATEDPNSNTDLVPVPVPGADVPMQATLVDGELFVALKPMCEAIGMDVWSQQRKLDQVEWARTAKMTARDSAGRQQQMVGLHADCIPMWLATVSVNKVAEHARLVLITYQREASKALRDYFYRDVAIQPHVRVPGTINPAAADDRFERIARETHAQAEVLRALEGIVDAKHLEVEGRKILARALSEISGIDPGDAPLRVRDYLVQRGIEGELARMLESEFDELLATLPITPRRRRSGARRQTGSELRAYTEADRPRFDLVWERLYGTHPSVTVALPPKGLR